MSKTLNAQDELKGEISLKKKIRGVLKWGLGAYSLVMTNNLVVSGAGLFTGVMHLFTPMQSMMFDSMILSVLLIIYALVSITFVLTDNDKAAKGKQKAGGLIKEYIDGKIKDATLEDVLKKDTAVREYARDADKRRDAFTDRIEDFHIKTRSSSKIVMLVFYSLILAVSVFLFIRRDVAVYVNNIIIGVVLIVDGVLSIISATSAKKERVYKFYVFSLILSVTSVVLGIMFIVFSQKTGVAAMQAVSVVLIVKSLAGFFVAIRNKKVISSITDTLTLIKNQEMSADEPEEKM